MTKLPVVLVSCLSLGLGLGACGGDDNDDGGGGGGATSAPATQEQPAGGGAASKSAKVTMKDIQFNPTTVTVKAGGTVTWTNDETVNHDVTKKGGPGKDFKSGTGNIGQGKTYKQTFTTPGTVSYVCTIHPGMAGKVVVT